MAPLADGALTIAQIVFVNVVLSGDNALVIALTARQLPAPLRRHAVLWGSALAVLLQVLFAIAVGRLLEVPGLRLAGALALVIIARKLAGDMQDADQETRSSQNILGAVLAIVVANLAMSFDNVMAVGALSRGLPALIAVGIGVSAVVLLAASSLVIALIERYRWLTMAGAGLLAFTAAGMICEEPLLAGVMNTAEARANVTLPPAAAASEDDSASDRPALPKPAARHATAAPEITDRIDRKWSLAVYILAFSACFGTWRRRAGQPGFVLEPDAAIIACASD